MGFVDKNVEGLDQLVGPRAIVGRKVAEIANVAICGLSFGCGWMFNVKTVFSCVSLLRLNMLSLIGRQFSSVTGTLYCSDCIQYCGHCSAICVFCRTFRTMIVLYGSRFISFQTYSCMFCNIV